MPYNKPYVLWSYNNDVNHTPYNRPLWNKLPPSEKLKWEHIAKVNSHWIKVNCLKRCSISYKRHGTLVAKSKTDDIWYIVDDSYRKGNQIQGTWPTINGKLIKSKEIKIQTKWTENGLCLHFSRF
jgi:hypothetical protein